MADRGRTQETVEELTRGQHGGSACFVRNAAQYVQVTTNFCTKLYLKNQKP